MSSSSLGHSGVCAPSLGLRQFPSVYLFHVSCVSLHLCFSVLFLGLSQALCLSPCLYLSFSHIGKQNTNYLGLSRWAYLCKLNLSHTNLFI